MTLSHVNRKNRPAMVNVSAKKITHRTARARAIVALPRAVLAEIGKDDVRSRKGPVLQTAIVAGIMAARRTSELIPLCHPIAIEDCAIDISLDRKNGAVIECSVEAHHKTGVEMEALTGAAVAALTIYDMCKGVSHDIVIKDLRLIEKTGGKRDYKAR